MAKHYAGIGSRSTPPHVLESMEVLGDLLGSLGWTLRSGAAPGADSAFERGAGDYPKEIYLPWKGFGGSQSRLFPPTDKAYALARAVHPRWGAMRKAGQALQARNSHQVYGGKLDSPVAFVLAWTPDGAETATTRQTGGTGQAIRLALRSGIPVYNMRNLGALERLYSEVLGF